MICFEKRMFSAVSQEKALRSAAYPAFFLTLLLTSLVCYRKIHKELEEVGGNAAFFKNGTITPPRNALNL